MHACVRCVRELTRQGALQESRVTEAMRTNFNFHDAFNHIKHGGGGDGER